jgi:histidyl-tRNA synthetase
LAESLGSRIHSPGIGFSIGEDRLVMSVESTHQPVPLDLYIAPLGEAAVQAATLLARDLRRQGISVELSETKLKKAMEIANKLGARFTLIIGDNEIATGQYTLKNMSTGEQLAVAPDQVAQASRPASGVGLPAYPGERSSLEPTNI